MGKLFNLIIKVIRLKKWKKQSDSKYGKYWQGNYLSKFEMSVNFRLRSFSFDSISIINFKAILLNLFKAWYKFAWGWNLRGLEKDSSVGLYNELKWSSIMTVPVEPWPYPDSIKRIYGKIPRILCVCNLLKVFCSGILCCMCNPR